MVRRHGWELPLHPYQVAAVTLFMWLVVAFYIFFSPFIGSGVLKYITIGVYTHLVLAVFILYIRSSAIDPSDPGVLRHSNNISNHEVGVTNSSQQTNQNTLMAIITCLSCGWLLKDDGCGDKISHTIQDKVEGQKDEEIYECKLCKALVGKRSKHCSSCDKCVDRFDHHCRWLNGCVGRKNYTSFVALMVSTLGLLIAEGGIGVAVLIRCFIDKRETDRQIVDHLGASFSRPPFMFVVALCTTVSLLATIPLGQLFFFHVILMKKGITTFDYVRAMQSEIEQPESLFDVDQESTQSSENNSTATGHSKASSIGLQYKGNWCTPPRVFVDYQEEEVITQLVHDHASSTLDPTGSNARLNRKARKQAVRINAWKLAKLNPDDATRAGARAREKSSVLRPVAQNRNVDYNSNGHVSSKSSIASDNAIANEAYYMKTSGSSKSSYAGSHKSPDETDTIIQSRYASPGQGNDSLGIHAFPENQRHRLVSRHSVLDPSAHLHREVSARPEGNVSRMTNFHLYNSNSQFEVARSSDKNVRRNSKPFERGTSANNSVSMPSYVNPLNRNVMLTRIPSIYWDEGAGRYLSTPLPGRSQLSRGVGDLNTIRNPESVSTHFPVILPSQKILRSLSSPIQSDSLFSSEESIFYGGPIITPTNESSKKENPPRNNDSFPAFVPHKSEEGRARSAITKHSETPVFLPSFMQESASARFPYTHPPL